MAALIPIAVRHDLAIIEDAAQAHGAWRNVGSIDGFIRTAAFSFYPTKNLGACGDGGSVVSDDEELIERVKVLRAGGQPPAVTQRIAGRNSRLDEMQAAILRVKLRSLDGWNASRSRIADMYDELLGLSKLTLPVARLTGRPHANHLYVLRAERRDELRSFLSAEGIETAIHYPTPLDREILFSGEHARDTQPNADAAVSRIVSLPMNSHTEDWEISTVTEAIMAFERR
jgi:dTDP-4-amino-4,6-dideoxygalactose transaminase